MAVASHYFMSNAENNRLQPKKTIKKRRERTRSRGWCFTWFHFTSNDVLRLRRLGRDDKSIPYLIFGRERCPDTGRRHLQGYIYFTHQKELSGVKKILECTRVHLEQAKGSSLQNFEYCSKEHDFEEYGSRPTPGQRTDLLEIRDRIRDEIPEKDLAEQYFTQWTVYRRSFTEYRRLVSKPKLREELRVFLLHGEAGSGKTFFVWEHTRQHGRSLFPTASGRLQWFDGYGGETDVLIDDFRGGADYDFLLRLLDKYPLQVPIKGGFVQWIPQTIWITSNLPFTEWYPGVEGESLRALSRRITRDCRVVRNNSQWARTTEHIKRELNLE